MRIIVSFVLCIKMSFESDKRDYEKQLYAWLKASADRDGQALSSLSKVFMGTDGSSSARSATESDVVAILAAILAAAGYLVIWLSGYLLISCHNTSMCSPLTVAQNCSNIRCMCRGGMHISSSA